MAEKMLLAFGRYLKLVRERRKLSLEDVATLTKSYPEPINKGYLSRVERGLARVGFSKMVALSHAYDVSLDVFGEKLALDLEVDRLKDAPDTRGKTFGELLESATAFRERGLRWHVYACVRDAMPKAFVDPLHPNYRNRDEQVIGIARTFGGSASNLGRYVLALSELEFVSARNELLRDELKPLVFHAMSNAERHLGRIEASRIHADKAIELAMASASRRYLGHALQTRALLANQAREFEAAVDFEKQAFAAFRDAGSSVDAARSLTNLAQSYFDMGRMKAARRALGAADRLASKFDSNSTRSRSRILLGEIESSEGNLARASSLWHEALEIARQTHDSVVHFKAEHQLFKLAISQGNKTVVNALGRRLERMAPWISPSEPEVGEFRRLYAIHRKPKQRSVAALQLERPIQRNRDEGGKLS
jgi:tetratricopeptide (TPR) repeat protein